MCRESDVILCSSRVNTIRVALLVALVTSGASQEEAGEQEGQYRGRFIGKLNSYHHQVSGEVYAVDAWSVTVVGFTYDGGGEDTFWWAGETARPGPQGRLLPDERGTTDVLGRYAGRDVTLKLPGRGLAELRWLAVYDIATQNTFADVYLPEEFEPPAPVTLPPLSGPGVRSGPLVVEDDATLLIQDFQFDGRGETYFWFGDGPQPSAKGHKIPDEYGYLEPLRARSEGTVRLRVPGGASLRAARWVGVWDAAEGRSLAHASLPAPMWVPPAPAAPPAAVTPAGPSGVLPHCAQLHRRLQVHWELFGEQVTVEIRALLEEGEYASLGAAGTGPPGEGMTGADLAVVWYDGKTQRPEVRDYNVTERTPCTRVLGAWRGVCRDEVVGGSGSLQVLGGSRAGAVTSVVFRRGLAAPDGADRAWQRDGPTRMVWAIGRLDPSGEPSFHQVYPKVDVYLNFGDANYRSDCVPFTSEPARSPSWEVAELSEPSLRVFTATLGPGVWGAGRDAAPPLVWYVNGHPAPALQLRRGLTYKFFVRGGDDPHSAALYHPLVISVARLGGPGPPDESALRAARVLAGVTYTRRGAPHGAAAGPACVGRHAAGADRRRDADFPTFRAFNRSLEWSCREGPAAELTVTPDASWPDVVHYESLSHAGMGGRVFVVDRQQRGLSRRNLAAPSRPTCTLLSVLALVSLVRL